MIEVRGLKKTFDGFAALDGADLSVPRGAVYGLVGPNGAGKTTLLRHLTGVYHQDSGSVTFDGQPVWENPGVKARIASIPDVLLYAGGTARYDALLPRVLPEFQFRAL